jgi:hypothetical protein
MGATACWDRCVAFGGGGWAGWDAPLLPLEPALATAAGWRGCPPAACDAIAGARVQDDELDEIGVGGFHYMAGVVCGLANASDAVELMSISFILPFFKEQTGSSGAPWLRAAQGVTPHPSPLPLHCMRAWDVPTCRCPARCGVARSRPVPCLHVPAPALRWRAGGVCA